MGTLTDFNIFKSRIGIFKQQQGLPMGGCLSPLLSNLFLHMLEKLLVTKFIKQGKVKFWKRYADDIICIVTKDSVEEISTKINNWDSQLTFTVEKMTENKLIFLESEIFILDNQIQFKHFRKFEQKTVLSNFKHSKMSKKYLKANIITQCNNILDACSSYDIFLSCLDDLRILLYRNEYPKPLVRERINIFLRSKEKPKLPDFNAILCLNYTSPQTEHHARKLLRKMKILLPEFHVSLALKTIKISQLFSKSAKAPPETLFETANTNYEFLCDCKSNYIGRCKRPLDHRIKEHFRWEKDKGNEIFKHVNSCPKFLSKQRKILRDAKSSQLKPRQVSKLKLDNNRSHFRIIAKNFKNHSAREQSEAYFIRTMRPDLKCQKEFKCFAIF